MVHDLAYADLCFDGYVAPSFLQVPGAKDVGVEFFSLSKSYNMAGWRIGFAVGNREMIAALARIKSYLDYGMFQPIQIAAIARARTARSTTSTRSARPTGCAATRSATASQRDRLADPEAARPRCSSGPQIPEPFKPWARSSSRSSCSRRRKVAVSPGIGFGEYGDDFVRFALIENEHRTRQAVRGIRKALGSAVVPRAPRRLPRARTG